MKATLKPLSGKYYGTEVELDTGTEQTTIVIGLRGDGTPSDRELQRTLGCSREQYDANEPVEYVISWGKGPEQVPAQEAWNDYRCDSHYETQAAFTAAEDIVTALLALELADYLLSAREA